MNPAVIFMLWGSLIAPPRREAIVVTGSAEAIPLEEADRSVTAMRVRGQDLLFNTHADLLQLDPSLDLRQRGPNGTQADLSIRGGSFGQTLVLWNGRRMSDPQSGHHNLDLPIPLESMDRVEVMRGSGSSLYGSDAVGGVVNIITRPPEAGEVRMRAALGSFGTHQERLFLAGVRGPLSGQLAASRDFSSGFVPNRDYRSLILSATGSYRSRLGMTDLDLALSDRPFGAAGFYGNFPSWERTKTWWAGVRQAVGEKTMAAFSYRRHTDLFYLYRDRPQLYNNRHAAESWQASVRRREPLTSTSTLFYGAEGFGETIDSTNLGGHGRGRGAAYASWDARVLRRFSFSAGVRSEVSRGLPGQWSPSVSAGYWAGSKVRLRAAVSRAFRVPSFTDLYYHDPANVGSPDLRAETAWSFEGGADWRPVTSLKFDVTVFQRRDSNGIDYVRASPGDIWRATNIQRLDFTGVEAGARWSQGAQALDLRYTGLHGVAAALPGLQSKYAFNYPVHAGLATWQTVVRRNTAVRFRVGALERLGRQPYAVWDAYAAWMRGRVRPFVQATNVANVRYEEIAGVSMPGRAVLGGVEIRLK